MPPIPGAVGEGVVAGPWAQTWAEELFLLYAENDWGILVFATDDNLTQLQQCRKNYMDATFNSCPWPYRQCFTILGSRHGFVIPFVHVLMEQRTIGHYRQVFQALKVAIRWVTYHNWLPQLVVCDFGNALKTALETEFPQAWVSGCYFHFNQSLWKRIQELGLAVPFHQDRNLAWVIHEIMPLGYLPLALVQMNFNTIINGRCCRHVVRHYPAADDFLTYMRNTCISDPAPLFHYLCGMPSRGMWINTQTIMSNVSVIVKCLLKVKFLFGLCLIVLIFLSW